MRRSTTATAGDSPAATVVAPREWGRQAGCAAPDLDGVLREVFTTDTWTPWDTDTVTVCRGRPVRPACAAYAASITARAGIWGGWRRTDHLPVPHPHRALSVAAATIRR